MKKIKNLINKLRKRLYDKQLVKKMGVNLNI